jgi:hypothetical protein
MTQPRQQTINSRGEIVSKPYGSSRWATPKKYPCAHKDCTVPATVLRTASAHPEQVDKTHNCCGGTH